MPVPRLVKRLFLCFAILIDNPTFIDFLYLATEHMVNDCGEKIRYISIEIISTRSISKKIEVLHDIEVYGSKYQILSMF